MMQLSNWAEYDEVRKRLYIGQMIINLSEELEKNNPVRFLWCPKDHEEEFKLLWDDEISKSKVRDNTGEHTPLTPEHPRFEAYNPPIKPSEACSLPAIFTFKDEREAYHKSYFLNVFKLSEKDPKMLPLFDLKDTSALSAFHMVGEVLIPAVLKKLEKEAQEAKEKEVESLK